MVPVQASFLSKSFWAALSAVGIGATAMFGLDYRDHRSRSYMAAAVVSGLATLVPLAMFFSKDRSKWDTLSYDHSKYEFSATASGVVTFEGTYKDKVLNIKKTTCHKKQLSQYECKLLKEDLENEMRACSLYN
jgi:hypothetical protein